MCNSELAIIFFNDIMSNSKKFVNSATIRKQRSINDKDVLINLETLKYCDIEKYVEAFLA